MKTASVVALLVMLAGWAARAEDYPVKFGEIRNGVVTPTRTLKNCEPSTGYVYGFEISLPASPPHVVRIGFMTPAIPGEECVSCRSFTDDFGAHAGRFVKSLDIGTQVGAHTLKVFVDDGRLVSQIDYQVVDSKSCP
jgi:hypothetical protein